MKLKYEQLNLKYSNSSQIINPNEEDESICFSYRENILKQLIFCLFIILSLGTLLLIFYWKPQWKVYFTCSLTNHENATVLLIKDLSERYFVVNIEQIEIDQTASQGYQTTRSKLPSRSNDNVDEDLVESSVDSNSSTQSSRLPPLTKNKTSIKFYTFQALRYAWHDDIKSFKKIRGLDEHTLCSNLLDSYKGFTTAQQAVALKYYGINSIDVKVKSYGRLFVEEVLTPFYIFQILACALWMTDAYYYYAFCIIVISLISMILSLVETKRQSVTLHDMVKSRLVVNVCRTSDIFEEVNAEQIVPGDIIEIPSDHESTMSCDAVLLNGNCIVNESMLTGESVPVIKTPLPHPHADDANEIYDVEVHKRSTLFNGTRIVQTRSYDKKRVLAVVVRTGFSTSKGDLVRSILYPKPMGFKFYQDSMKFIVFMFIISFIGMTYGTVTLAMKGIHVYDLVMRALDIITIVVPPALPAAMTVGTVYAQSRLKKRHIFCISPPRINVCGKLKLICFDKTGTLTEDGLDLWGVVGVNQSTTTFEAPTHNVSELVMGPLFKSLASCHSLTRFDGSLTGDPLDVKMFESTSWTFVDEQLAGTCRFEQLTPVVRQSNPFREGDIEIAIVKQFTFSSSLLRMSVLCKTHNTDYMEVFTKGAPEKILELCRAETIPANFSEQLHNYTANGYRVIAMAGKQLDSTISWAQASKLTRENIESNLVFHGLLIMQNMIKPETIPVITELNNADITTVMVTGDNLLTALCVGRKCGIVKKSSQVVLVEASEGTGSVPARIEWKLAEHLVDPDEPIASGGYQHDIQTNVVLENADNYCFAMTGKTFGIVRKSFRKIFEKILVNGVIYARMSPDQKAQLVEHLISLGYGVSMCGDGANDCGALKAAHVGISLSEAEASVAAPFTSKIQNISCVPEVIKEGRAALVTSFGVFKYMALYSMIQFISVLILYTYFTNLADQQFLYVDLFLITPVAVFMSANKAYEKLAIRRPLGSLVGFVNICSIMFQILLVLVFQIGTLIYLTWQPWYVPHKEDKEHFKQNIKCMETTIIFLVSTYMYVIMALVYSKGPPYRKPISDNFYFILSLLVLTACNLWITLSPLPIFKDLLQMVDLDPKHPISLFRFSIVGIAFIFFIFSYLIEECIVDAQWFKIVGRKIVRKKHPKNKYKIIKAEVRQDKQWPYIGRITFDNEDNFDQHNF